MNKFITATILLIPISLTAQWSYQLGIGRVLGTKDAFASALLTDSLAYSYSKKGLNTTSVSIMAAYRINEKLLIRTGLDQSKSTVDVRVENTQTGFEIDERRTVSDFHIPAEVQYEVAKGFFLNGGFSTNARLEFGRFSIEEWLGYDSFSNNPTVQEFEKIAYNSMREVSVNYRLGTTLKFLPWLGVDLMYDRPFASLVKPLKYEGDIAKPNFKYGIWTMRLTYFFEWEKLKKTLSK